jgi:hypothetical protein
MEDDCVDYSSKNAAIRTGSSVQGQLSMLKSANGPLIVEKVSPKTILSIGIQQH